MALVAYAALVQASNNLNLAYKQTYIAMARTASKAAVDYAQEQFDNAICGSYTGTAEQDLISNNRYRVTFKAEVTATSSDGYEKTIKGTGSVYLPKLSDTAQYVFDVRSEIVRTYAVCKTPDNFSPTVWLDASDTTKLHSYGTATSTQNPYTSYGNATDSTRDTLEERVDNGTQTSASWQSDDFEMHTCDATEFSSALCTSSSTKYLYSGLIFSNITVPKNAIITSATFQANCATPSGVSGAEIQRVYGIYKSSTNPHPDLFTSIGTNQIRTPMTTSGMHTTAYVDTDTNNCPPGNNSIYDVTSVVQEIVNNPNWDPTGAGNGGRLGLAMKRISGSGTRHLLKGNLLTISYSTTVVGQADNHAALGQWDDISGNGNNAIFKHGTAPTREDDAINGKTAVRFNNGDLMSTLSTPLSGKREMTVLAVIKANFSTSASDGRAISGMTSTGSNDTTAGTSIIPLLRNAATNGFSNIYSGSTSTYRTDYTCGSACSSNAYTYAGIFSLDDASSSITSTLKGNGLEGAQRTGLTPTGSPYTYGIDQIYFGGRRSGSGTGSGVNYFNGDFAEIIVYDHALTCQQIESLEEYLRAKWNTYPSQLDSACAVTTVPTL
jgi:hypothetical protein